MDSSFATVTGIIIGIEPFKPSAEVFAMLHARSRDLTADKLTTAVVGRNCGFAERAPLSNLYRTRFVRGVLFYPLKNFPIIQTLGNFCFERFRINTRELQKTLIDGTSVVVFAIRAREHSATFVQHTRKNDITAETSATTAGRMII